MGQNLLELGIGLYQDVGIYFLFFILISFRIHYLIYCPHYSHCPTSLAVNGGRSRQANWMFWRCSTCASRARRFYERSSHRRTIERRLGVPIFSLASDTMRQSCTQEVKSHPGRPLSISWHNFRCESRGGIWETWRLEEGGSERYKRRAFRILVL